MRKKKPYLSRFMDGKYYVVKAKRRDWFWNGHKLVIGIEGAKVYKHKKAAMTAFWKADAYCYPDLCIREVEYYDE
ncbi:MAG: hypothetical protein NC124_02185 [Clostridium sp.]|nr:hypothetical protein [Clostridium sp.]